jgi:hypothetical protein
MSDLQEAAEQLQDAMSNLQAHMARSAAELDASKAAAQQVLERQVGALVSELQSGGNVRLERGGPGDAWSGAVADMVSGRLVQDDPDFCSRWAWCCGWAWLGQCVVPGCDAVQCHGNGGFSSRVRQQPGSPGGQAPGHMGHQQRWAGHRPPPQPLPPQRMHPAVPCAPLTGTASPASPCSASAAFTTAPSRSATRRGWRS